MLNIKKKKKNLTPFHQCVSLCGVTFMNNRGIVVTPIYIDVDSLVGASFLPHFPSSPKYFSLSSFPELVSTVLTPAASKESIIPRASCLFY